MPEDDDMNPLAQIFARILGKDSEEEKKKTTIGELTDSEKIEMLELDALQENIKSLIAKHQTLKHRFWSGIEIRLNIFEKSIKVNTETGELFTED